jgi:hypothetical protein
MGKREVVVTKTVTNTDTLVKWQQSPHDTVEIKVPTLVHQEPLPPDSFIQFETLPSDTAAIVKPYLVRIKDLNDKYNSLYGQYAVKRTFSDSLKYKGIAYGYYRGEVKNNVLTNFKAGLDSVKLTTIFTNTTNTVEQKRVIGYLGAHIQYGLKSGDILVGPSFSIKDKKDRVYGIYGLVGGIDKNAVGFQINFPIKLHK